MQYLNFSQLRAKLGGRARSSIYLDMAAGRLPAPIKLGGPTLQASGLKQLHSGWAAVPILMLDGTADHAFAETLIGRKLDRVVEVRCHIPMLTVRQDEAFTGAKNRILSAYSEKDEITVRNNQMRLERILKRVAQETIGQTAFFSYAKLEEAMEGRVPEGMLTGHFNSLRGVNAYGAANAGVIIGRTLAPSQTLEHLAEAIFNKITAGEMLWKAAVTRLVRGSDGLVYEVPGVSASHDDENVRRVIHQTRDAEAIQALHRLRPVNRLEGRDQPVEIIIASDAVLDVPVELGPYWDQMSKSDPVEDMLEEAGIAFLSPSHASRAFPHLWKTAQAAQYALRGVADDAAKNANNVSIGGFCSVVTYGQVRQADRFTALVDLTRHADPLAFIQKMIPTAKDIRMEKPDTNTKGVRTEFESYSAQIIPFLRGGKLDLNLAATGDVSDVLRTAQAGAMAQLVNLQQFRGMSEQEVEARKAMLRRRAKALRSDRCDDLAEAKEHLVVMAELNEMAFDLCSIAV